jgi:hypothetical protein
MKFLKFCIRKSRPRAKNPLDEQRSILVQEGDWLNGVQSSESTSAGGRQRQKMWNLSFGHERDVLPNSLRIGNGKSGRPPEKLEENLYNARGRTLLASPNFYK